MKIVVASTSALKLQACRDAFVGAEVMGVKVASGVNEQPINDETLTGAFNRIKAAQTAAPGADLYISIENGLFEENGTWVDHAIVVIDGGNPHVASSEGVEFPADCVEEALKRGCTAGRVMHERGLVKQHDDPHKDLTGKSRSEYISETVRRAALALGRA